VEKRNYEFIQKCYSPMIDDLTSRLIRYDLSDSERKQVQDTCMQDFVFYFFEQQLKFRYLAERNMVHQYTSKSFKHNVARVKNKLPNIKHIRKVIQGLRERELYFDSIPQGAGFLYSGSTHCDPNDPKLEKEFIESICTVREGVEYVKCIRGKKLELPIRLTFSEEYLRRPVEDNKRFFQEIRKEESEPQSKGSN